MRINKNDSMQRQIRASNGEPVKTVLEEKNMNSFNFLFLKRGYF